MQKWIKTEWLKMLLPLEFLHVLLTSVASPEVKMSDLVLSLHHLSYAKLTPFLFKFCMTDWKLK